MKKIVSALIVGSLLTTGAFAKGTPPKTTKKRDFATVKKEEIAKLERKMEILKKRIACVKNAKKKADIRECRRKYPLVNRKKHKKHSSKEMEKRAQRDKKGRMERGQRR
ncbi:MAG: hypothetical protein GXO61_02380 [Epsilonproteobacteria bacterium]|nr:hypothetical protein [Campylobacterota bacterium]